MGKKNHIDIFLGNLDAYMQEIWDVVKVGEPIIGIQDDNYGDKSESGGTLQIAFRPGNFDAIIKITGLKNEKEHLIFRSYHGGGDRDIYKALAILAYAMKKAKK